MIPVLACWSCTRTPSTIIKAALACFSASSSTSFADGTLICAVVGLLKLPRPLLLVPDFWQPHFTKSHCKNAHWQQHDAMIENQTSRFCQARIVDAATSSLLMVVAAKVTLLSCRLRESEWGLRQSCFWQYPFGHLQLCAKCCVQSALVNFRHCKHCEALTLQLP